MAVEALSTAGTYISPVVIYWNESADNSLFFSWHGCIHKSFWLDGFRFMFTNFLTTLSHASLTALKEINMFHNNFMATLSPHTSNRLQPLVLAVYGLFTLYLSQEVKTPLKFGIHRRTNQKILSKYSLVVDKAYFLK